MSSSAGRRPAAALSFSAASRPNSRVGNPHAGQRRPQEDRAISRSSKPITVRSSGTRRPLRCAACRAPAAISSVAGEDRGRPRRRRQQLLRTRHPGFEGVAAPHDHVCRQGLTHALRQRLLQPGEAASPADRKWPGRRSPRSADGRDRAGGGRPVARHPVAPHHHALGRVQGARGQPYIGAARCEPARSVIRASSESGGVSTMPASFRLWRTPPDRRGTADLGLFAAPNHSSRPWG